MRGPAASGPNSQIRESTPISSIFPFGASLFSVYAKVVLGALPGIHVG